jgi:hypothetical protein
VRDPSNTSRFRYLQQLSEWANLLPDRRVGKEVDDFVETMRLHLLEHIQRPTEQEVELLMIQAQTISVIQNTYVLLRSPHHPASNVDDVVAGYCRNSGDSVVPQFSTLLRFIYTKSRRPSRRRQRIKLW